MSRVKAEDAAAAGPVLVERIAGQLAADAPAIAAAMADRIEAEVPALAGPAGAEMRDALRRSCAANVAEGMAELAAGRPPADATPPEATELAQLMARMGRPLTELLRAYRIGHAYMWSRWFAAVEQAAAGDEERRAALEQGTRFQFAYVDRLCAAVSDEHVRAREALLRSREQRRTQLVRDVLDGAEPDAARSRTELDYDLLGHHLACVAAGPDPEAAIRELARAVDARDVLVVELSAGVAWGWAGRSRPHEGRIDVLLEPGATLAIGDAAVGLEGFRRSHAEAREAHRLALRTGAPLTRYDDVALEAFALADEARARAFAARELHGIDGPDPRARRLRETLRAWFATGQNASAAAAVLGVHEHTVAYRLRAVEERLRRPVAARRAELELALRLALVLDAQDADGD